MRMASSSSVKSPSQRPDRWRTPSFRPSPPTSGAPSAPRPAGGQVVVADGGGARRAVVLPRRAPPGLVDAEDHPRLVEDGDETGQGVEDGAEEALRLGQLLLDGLLHRHVDRDAVKRTG